MLILGMALFLLVGLIFNLIADSKLSLEVKLEGGLLMSLMSFMVGNSACGVCILNLKDKPTVLTVLCYFYKVKHVRGGHPPDAPPSC